jgi:hypothetical protein
VGALAAGDFAAGRGAVERMSGVEGGPLATLLAARLALASGDQAAALDRMAALRPDAIERFRAGGADVWRGWPAALRTLADALRHGAAETDLDALRAEARRAPAAAGGGLRLPMAGAPPAYGRSWHGHLIGAGAAAHRDRPDGPPPPALAAWTAFAEGRSDEGWAAWRRSLSAGMSAGPAGRGTLDPSPDEGEGAAAPAAALLLATLVHGLLGVDVDAPAGRLRLAPAFPPHVRSFSARNLRVAEARIALAYERGDGVHRFRLEPVGGRVPVMAVLEPSLPGRVGSVRVDGRPADLEVSDQGARTRVAVQLPLDATRTLEIGES